MTTFSSIFLLLALALVSYDPSMANPLCTPDSVDFATKVNQSSIVVYGKTMAKMMNEESDSVFHVFFQVDCILKGPATLRQINITNAGHVAGKKYCQEFPVGRGYAIAFLEPSPMNTTDLKTFVPADFVEIVDDGSNVQSLLARTCSLHRLVPMHSSALVTEICPAVATDPQCQTTNIEQTSTASLTTEAPLATTNGVVVLSVKDGHLSKPIPNPQQEIEAIRGKSGLSQVNVDQPSAGQSVTVSLFGLFMALLSLRLI